MRGKSAVYMCVFQMQLNVSFLFLCGCVCVRESCFVMYLQCFGQCYQAGDCI